MKKASVCTNIPAGSCQVPRVADIYCRHANYWRRASMTSVLSSTKTFFLSAPLVSSNSVSCSCFHLRTTTNSCAVVSFHGQLNDPLLGRCKMICFHLELLYIYFILFYFILLLENLIDMGHRSETCIIIAYKSCAFAWCRIIKTTDRWKKKNLITIPFLRIIAPSS